MNQNLFKSLQKPIMVDINGSIDDFVSLILLLSLPEYRIAGITINAGKSFLDEACDITLRILSLFCRHDIMVAKGNGETKNPLCEELCSKSIRLVDIKRLNKQTPNYNQVSKIEVTDFIAQKINEEKEKVKIVMTGPAVSLNNTIEKHPDIKDKIEKVIWAGGAFMTDGNVIAPDHDGSAEWNFYCNPEAAQNLLKTGIPIIIFPLDITNHLPIDNYLIYHLDQNKKKKLSKLVLKILEPEYEAKKSVSLKGVVAAIYLAHPDYFQFESKLIGVEQRGTSMGNIFKTSLGSKIKYASFIDDESCYEFIIEQFMQF